MLNDVMLCMHAVLGKAGNGGAEVRGNTGIMGKRGNAGKRGNTGNTGNEGIISGHMTFSQSHALKSAINHVKHT